MTLPLPSNAAGLGLRRGLIDELLAMPAGAIDFLEVSPDNWIGVGGAHGAALRRLSERHPLTCHGLSLSLGGPDPLDRTLLAQTRAFLDLHQVQLYSEHLSYCAAGGHVYDLLPLPFTAEAVHHIAGRIAQVQDMLGRRIAVENISYYAVAGADMSEIDFINAVLAEADCDLLLDVNNVYVNACNHGYDADTFIAGLPAERIVCLHVAGHLDEAPDLKIDTHGSAVIDPVWELLARTYARIGARPTLLERDFNFPPYAELQGELQTIRRLQATHAEKAHG